MSDEKSTFRRACALCGSGTFKSKDPTQQKLKKCDSCYSARYCCRDHQKQHWPVHKPICKEITAKYQDMKKTAILNESFDTAIDFIKNDDPSSLSDLLVDRGKKGFDLANWHVEEYSLETLLVPYLSFSSSYNQSLYVSIFI